MKKGLNLLLMLLLVNAFALQAQMYILSEDFSTTSDTIPPINWNNIIISGDTMDLWHFDNPGGQTIGFPVISPFAIFDAGAYSNNGQPEIVALETRSFDASVSNYILLLFDHTFSPANGALAKLSAYNGSEWLLVAEWNIVTDNPASEIINISPFVGGITNARLRFTWEGDGAGYWAIDNVRILAPLSIDAGLTKLDSPAIPFTPGTHPVQVTLANFGYQNLTSTSINWKANGVSMPTFQWTGNLSFAQKEGNIELGTYNFQEPTLLEIWQSMPNGQPDLNSNNDSIVRFLWTSLCGIYTIGGVNPDFDNFSEAAAILNMAGISCPVTFMVRDGDYNEQFILNDIQGSSSINTITFLSESGDSSAVLVHYDVWPKNTVILKKTKYTKFKGIGIQGSLIGLLLNDAYHVNIENCLLQGNYAVLMNDSTSFVTIKQCAVSGGNQGIQITEGSHDIDIMLNTFNNFNHGIVMYLSKGVSISNNSFQYSNLSSVYLENNRTIMIDGNQMTGNSTGVFSYRSQDLTVMNNKVKVNSSNWHNVGIFIIETDTAIVYNNYIITEGIYASTGIYLQNSQNLDIYFNSINICNTDNEGDSKGLWIEGGAQNSIRNNIFCIKKNGFPAFISPGTQNYTTNFNDYFSPSWLIGKCEGVYYYEIEDWRNVTGQDDYSWSENPFYTSDTVLSMHHVLLNDAAVPVPGILYDIDSTLRNATQPDIGAKEYNPCQPDAGINRITSPTNPVTPGITDVKVILQNQGSGSLNSVTINWEVNNVLQVPYLWSGNLPYKGNTEVTIGSYNFEGGLFNLSAWTSLPNGLDDCNNYNDSTTIRVAATLCGIYTIGGVNPDFVNFTEAANVLIMSGISCPVTFMVRNGDYNEQFALNDIQGASAINTITFMSESGDSTAVLLHYDVWPQHTITLNNTKYMKFKGIGIQSAYSGILLNNAYQINIENCFLQGYYGIYTYNSTNYVTVKQCAFLGGHSGIYLTNESHDIIINLNTIKDQAYHGIVMNWSNGVSVTNNLFDNYNYSSVYLENYNRNILIDSNQMIGNRTGVISNSSQDLKVMNNRININALGGWYDIGILVSGTDTAKVYNNYIITKGIYPSTGIYLQNSQNLGIYFNSINICNTDIEGDSKGLWIEGGTQSFIKNNIFSITEYGYPAFISPGTQNFTADFNNYYNPFGLIGKFEGIDYYSLDLWGSAINGDANSKTLQPYFVSEENPLPYQRDFNGAGIPIPGILLDINGKIRNDAAPDIGCVEFFVDFGVTDLINPTLDCFQTELENVTVLLRQFGDIPFIDLQVAYQVNYGTIFYDTVPGVIYNDLEFTFDATVNMSEEGEYFFKIWLINALDDNVSNDTLEVYRYSKPPPIVSFTYDMDCEEVQFYGQASVITPYYIAGYEWEFGDGLTSAEQNPIHIFPGVGSYLVTFRAYSDVGCFSQIQDTIYIPEPLPVSVSITESSNGECYGTPITFTAAAVNGGTNPSYQWQVNEINTGDDDPVFTYIPFDEDVVRVILSSSEPCTTGDPAISNEITMTVLPLLPVSVDITVSDSIVCVGTEVTFSANPINGGSEPSFQWQVNEINAGDNSNQFTYTPMDGDIVHAILTSSETCTEGNPATSNEITMDVLPFLPVSVVIIASDTIVCAGTEVTYTANPTNGGNDPFYQWQVNGTNVGDNSNQYTYVPVDDDIVHVILTSSETCTTGSPATSNEITMSVLAFLPISVTAVASDTIVCAGTEVTFTATPTNGGNDPFYQWQVNGINAGSDTTQFNYIPENGDVVNVMLTSNETCTTGNPATSNQITMTVLPLLPVSVTLVASDTTICAGTEVTFIANPTNGGNDPFYQWQVNGINVGTDTSEYSYVPENGDIVYVFLTSSEACPESNPATSSEIIMSVLPLLSVSAAIEASENNICSGTQVTFTAIPTNGGSEPLFQWQVNGFDIGTDSTQFTYVPVDEDIVHVILTSNEACTTSNPVTSNDIVMAIIQTLPVSVVIIPSDNNVCEGTDITFTANPVNGGSVPSYQWQVNGINAGTDNPEYTYMPENGDIVQITLTSNEICPVGNPALSNTVLLNLVPFSILNNELVTPNNDGEDDFFFINATCCQLIFAEIFDRRGIKVYDISQPDGKWDGNYKSGNEAPDGIYYYYIDAVTVSEQKYHKNGALKLIRDMITISPNPASKSITINPKGRIKSPVEVQVYDNLGNLVLSENQIYFDQQFLVDVSSLHDGLYLVKFWDDNNMFSIKLIIKK